MNIMTLINDCWPYNNQQVFTCRTCAAKWRLTPGDATVTTTQDGLSAAFTCGVCMNSMTVVITKAALTALAIPALMQSKATKAALQ